MMGARPPPPPPPPLPPLLLLLLLLLPAPLPLPPPAAAAAIAARPGSFGCLFEDDLCKPFEICVNDGVFGRCQRVPVVDVYRYEVSPSFLQHLKTILQKLSHRGFSWQDDYTQHIIAQELSSVQKIHNWRSEAFSSDGSSTARTSKPKLDDERTHDLEKDINLAKTFQQYLTYLGLFPQAAASSLYPGMKSDKSLLKSDGLPEWVLDYVLQKAKGGGPSLTYPQLTHPDYPENFPLRTFQQLQPDKFRPQTEADLNRQALIATLSAYTAQKVAASNLDKSSNGRTKGLPLYGTRFPVSPAGQYNEVYSKEGEDGLTSKPWFLPRMGARLLGPNSGVSNQKSASPAADPKEPLSTVDEAFIQTVLKDLRKHQVNVDNLSPQEIDEMADVIADVMQGVDRDRQGGVGRKAGGERGDQEKKRVDASEWEDYEAELMREDDLPDNGVQEGGDRVYEEVKGLGATLVDLVNEHESQRLSKEPPPEKPLKTEAKKSEDSEASFSSSEEEKTGVENVKSETFSKELTAEKKMSSEPESDEFLEFQHWMQGTLKQDERHHEGPQKNLGEGLQLEVKSSDDEEYGYIVTEKDPLSVEKGKKLLENVAPLLKLQTSIFADINVLGPAVTFKVSSNDQNITTADVAKAAVDNKDKLEKLSGLKILQTGIGAKSKLKLLPHHVEQEESTKFIILTLISIACIIGVLVASGVIYCLRHSSHHKLKEKLSALGTDPSSDATAAYQELCRQRMAVKSSDRPEPLHTSRINSVSSQFSDGPIPSPSARSSTSSWSEEPVQSNMDISTGHMILSYMEDHLKNKNRLEKEWEALCAYQAEPNAAVVAQKEENAQKNRSPSVVTYDHSRILLKSENSHDHSDYINASPIMDHDPRNPAYIATQGPLPATVADFWQMVWENGCVVIVMLTPLTENGVKQCYHYWPDEGSNLYHIYEVNLVSEHIWCEDFLVRSFYLKNLQTNETRTVTQFHFLSWYDQGVPSSTRSLLDFRRKVNKCYRGRSCPIIVHCSDGAGRSGTYVLIDMVLNKMAKGAKEIDIAATLEHLRDQRPGMVQTKEQFEFALTAVAEEVNAILKALPQ
uniref:Protein tyrosine phosphatase receptor type N2 n=1 Tax=Ornithorhynchus anatinus TaxID=9258 RepID=A0A6I8NE80_ORNAN